MFKVIDNFLDKKTFKKIQEGILDNESFPWYFGPVLDYVGEKGFDKSQFVHIFYNNNSPNSKNLELLLPIIKKLQCISLVRIKANSNYYTNKIIEGTYHIDNKHKETTTAIYYLNTNDGYTKFKINKKKIHSVENRMVIFNTDTEHLGTTTTNAKRRVVLNFNYF
tara:strand:- start:167 stop:661 length:495 start_codon:yes stop_codon:yes gene_type:complete